VNRDIGGRLKEMKEAFPVEKGGPPQKEYFLIQIPPSCGDERNKGILEKKEQNTLKQNGNYENNRKGKKSTHLFYFPFP